jgi:signal transduction histidine kinase
VENSNRKILIIDDDPGLRLGLAATLKHKGYTVAAAIDGLDGLSKARSFRPDMILCDVMMPPPNGFELKKILSSEAELAGIPFIFLTARAGIEDRLNGLDEGADDYITKPFEPKELLARVEAFFRRIELEQSRGREQMRSQAEGELDTFKHEILQNFHHEMRTPLTNIMMPLETILKHRFDNPEDQMRFVRIALLNADRLESLSTDFIILTNIDHGDLNTIRMHVDVESSLLAAARRRLERYATKELQLVTNISLLGNLTAPRKEFTHIVVHILDNAYKFSPEHGRVELSISTTLAGDATIRVQDEGPGIAPDLREKVFERFFQTSRGDTREYEGLGVGLTIARALLEKLGGSVKILDAPGGCLVELFLPADTQRGFSYASG